MDASLVYRIVRGSLGQDEHTGKQASMLVWTWNAMARHSMQGSSVHSEFHQEHQHGNSSVEWFTLSDVAGGQSPSHAACLH